MNRPVDVSRGGSRVKPTTSAGHTARLTSLELIAVLSILDSGDWLDSDARSGLHTLLEWYLNEVRERENRPLTSSVDLTTVSFLVEE